MCAARKEFESRVKRKAEVMLLKYNLMEEVYISNGTQ